MANEKRLIDAYEFYRKFIDLHTIPVGEQRYVATWRISDLIADAPTVDAVEVVHGRWEPRTDVFGFVRCSVCHDCNIYDDWADGKKWNYCPNCGAKMDGDGNG